MRTLKRNERKMFYARYSDKIDILDKDGNETGDSKSGYSAPVIFYANLSAGKSDSEQSPFGASVQYDRVLSTCDMNLPINVSSLVWVKNKPTYNADGSVNSASADYEVAAAPLDSLNGLLIAVKRRIATQQTAVTTETTTTTSGPVEEW